MALVSGEPTVRRGIQLPERADLKALPAAEGSGLTAGLDRMSQSVSDGPAAHGGRVQLKIQAAMHFGSREAVRSRWSGQKEFAHERFCVWRPVGRVIAARVAGSPERFLMSGGITEVAGIKFVETGATQSELFCGGGGGEFAAPKGGQDFTDQWCTQTVWKLTIMFFIAAKMRDGQPNGQQAIPALRAFRRPPLRSGLLQARRAGGVRLCSHTVRLCSQRSTIFRFTMV